MKINTILLPIIFLFLVSNNVIAQNSTIDNFIQCLPTKSDPSIPISKAIFTPSNPSFLSVLQAYVRDSLFNTSSTPKPLAIVTALDMSHVQATVLCAKVNGLQIRIRSGGHDYEGMSYVSNVPFVILDMFNLRSISIDFASKTGWVQAGATLGELYYKIAKTSNNTHAFPAGVSLTLGAGGHFSGGGYGNMIRQYGLSSDNIIDAQVVNANGQILDRKGMGEDLFWALRGGGGASFAVVLSWRIQFVQVPKIVTVFNIPRTLQQNATDIVLQWQQIATKIDRKLFIRVQPQVQFIGGIKTVQVLFIGMYLERASSLITLMNANFPRLGLKSSDCSEMPWVNTNLFWNGLPQTTPIEVLLQRNPTPSHTYQKRKSDYVKTAIPRAGLETIWNKMIEVENVFMQWNPYGGRMNEIPSNATAFPHRSGNLFKIQYLAIWQDDSDQARLQILNATKELHNTLTQFVSKNPREAFFCYRDIDIGTNVNGNTNFALDFFKSNVKRLLQIKAKVDPTNFFRYEQSIPLQTTSEYLIDLYDRSKDNVVQQINDI